MSQGGSALKKVLGLVGVIFAIVGLWRTYDANQNERAFNAYVATLRPLLAEQDALVGEISKTSDPEVPPKVEDWIARADALEQRFAAARPEGEELIELHRHLDERAHQLTAAMKVLRRLGTDEDQTAVQTEYQERCEAGRAALDAFVAARDAYFKRHDLALEE